MEKLLSKILEKIKKDAYLFQTWEDLLYMSKEAMKEDIPLGVKYLKLLSAECPPKVGNPAGSVPGEHGGAGDKNAVPADRPYLF